MPDRILCVEDNRDIGNLLVTILGQAGYTPEWVTDGERALDRWPQAGLVLLDLMLPRIDGLAVCRQIRQKDATVPIIMLTARAGTRDVVRGLELGADDYITKPFDSSILVARVKALLRRRATMQLAPGLPTPHPAIRHGDLRIDIDRHQVTLHGQAIPLTAKEFALLAMLARHPGRGFTRGELLDSVWGPEFDGFDHTVNTHINRLRGKIEADPSRPMYIHTIWGVGYRFSDADDHETTP